MLRSHCQLCGCYGALRHATLPHRLVPATKAAKDPWLQISHAPHKNLVYFTLDNMRDLLVQAFGSQDVELSCVPKQALGRTQLRSGISISAARKIYNREMERTRASPADAAPNLLTC
jgi:hypothetical protein